MDDPDWLSDSSSISTAPPPTVKVKFTYGSKSSSSSLLRASAAPLAPVQPSFVKNESENAKKFEKDRSRRPLPPIVTAATAETTSHAIITNDENEAPVPQLSTGRQQAMAQPLLKSKGKKGEKISSTVVTTTHEDKHSKIDNDDNDDLSHRSVSSRNDSALLQALTRLSIASSSSSSSSASTSYTMGSARSSEQYNHSKSSTKKRGLLKNKIAQGIRKSLAPSTMHSIATPSSSLSRSTIPLAPLSSSSTSSTLHSTATTTSTSSSSSLLKTKGVDNDIDDAISRISLPSTITDSRRERLKGRAVGFADVVSVSVGGGDLVDSDNEDGESLQSCETRVFTGRRTRTSFRSSAASFTSSSSSSSLSSSSSSSTVKFEYKTDDESDTDHDDVYSIQHYTGDSEFGVEDSYRTRNTNNEEAMNRAFRRISLAHAAFAAAKASRASVGGQRRFSVFQSTAEKVSSLINEEEEEEEDEDVNEQSVMTSLSDTPTTPCSESVFGTFLSSIFEYLPNSDISSSTSLVSKSWFAQSTHMLSWRAASAMTLSNFKRMVAQRGGGGGKKYVGTFDDRAVSSSLASCKRSWVAFLECYPWGRFLAEGAYKSVFKVWSAPRRRMEAVSVMDINAIAETGNLPIIQAEIQAACLLSHLVRTNVCPNFLNTFQVFVFGASPSNQEDFQGLWGAPPSYEGRVGTSGRNNGIEEDNSDKEDNNDSGNDNDSCPFDSVDIPSVAVAEKIISSSSSLTSQLKKRAHQCTRRVKTLKEHLPANLTVAASAASSPSLHGSYQFIRMELCSSGDVEELLRRREPQVLAVEMDAVKASVGNRGGGGGESYKAAQLALKRADTHAAYEAADMAFQMAFSLYAARERLSFRHFDVKLLNFLAKPARDLVIEELVVEKKGLAKKINGKESSIVRLAYSIGERIVNVDLPLGEGGEESTCGHIIKLADYGTASTNASSIDNAVHYTHFTTLENAPPEYMILGDAATQGFGADTWALGLCILHLFTGSCPYEEMMTTVARGDDEEEALTTIKNSSRTSNKSKNNSVVGVVCPQPLKDALRKVWMTTEVSPISSSSATSLSNSADVQQMEKGGKKSNTKSKKEVVAAPNQESASSKRKAVCLASLSSLGVCVEWICEDEEDGGDKNVNKKGSSSSSSSYASYRVIKKVLESSSDVTETADVFADTLYRYAVLLGLPEEGQCGNYSSVNPVWVLLNAACKGMTDKIGPSDADAAGGDGGKKTKKKSKKQEFASPSSAVLLTLSDIAACSSQYQADQRFASVDRGTNALLQRARRRSETLSMSLQQPKQPVKSNSSSSSMSISSGGAEKRNSNLLLDIVCGSEGLLAWDVKNRPTMASFLKNEVLHSGLKKMQSNHVDNDDDDDDDASNVVYKKKISFYSGDSLPDV